MKLKVIEKFSRSFRITNRNDRILFVKERASIRHHDHASFYCVQCANEDCKHQIPLLEYHPNEQRKNPPEFRVKCSFCGAMNLYHDAEVNIGTARRGEGSVPLKGFRNVNR